MHAEIHHSATPFKVLPKQSAGDTVIRHTLPVHRRGNDADTKGIMCTNVGGTNSKHSHTTRALSVHPTPRLKRPRQTSINKKMKREKQLPCKHFKAPQQRHQQQERATLCLQQCTFLCSWPLGALNTTRPSRAHKASRTQMPFIFSANGVAVMNHVQIIHKTPSKVPFHCQKKDKNVLKSQRKYHSALLTAHCPAHDRCYSPLCSSPIPFLPSRTYITVAIPPKKDFTTC
ncbi:hypothetical protein TCDM_11402 [Trypanosoma cruzi Dm28c]|uniref:Uncharacterized protein n=1 Tax=Trypanosoma cruzi Dm28c TaxID=1416333 RepID=V5B9K1_TRYCR|nr:hypothetical protein TCDM_11402 [Trypanosoma cruzi Dm28c]